MKHLFISSFMVLLFGLNSAIGRSCLDSKSAIKIVIQELEAESLRSGILKRAPELIFSLEHQTPAWNRSFDFNNRIKGADKDGNFTPSQIILELEMFKNFYASNSNQNVENRLESVKIRPRFKMKKTSFSPCFGCAGTFYANLAPTSKNHWLTLEELCLRGTMIFHLENPANGAFISGTMSVQ
jgi:hypothetical protein